MNEERQNYIVKIKIKIIDLSNDYNKCVKFASDMMNEPPETSPYLISSGEIKIELDSIPSKNKIDSLVMQVCNSIKKDEKYILCDAYFNGVEIKYLEN